MGLVCFLAIIFFVFLVYLFIRIRKEPQQQDQDFDDPAFIAMFLDDFFLEDKEK